MCRLRVFQVIGEFLNFSGSIELGFREVYRVSTLLNFYRVSLVPTKLSSFFHILVLSSFSWVRKLSSISRLRGFIEYIIGTQVYRVLSSIYWGQKSCRVSHRFKSYRVSKFPKNYRVCFFAKELPSIKVSKKKTIEFVFLKTSYRVSIPHSTY